jgi:ATP-dependent Clp protease ATP-binding subunit ClpC
LIILTSNIGVKESISFGKNMGFETESNIVRDENRVREILEKALKKKFKPEFLNRIDEAIIFNSLTRENINEIIYVELAKLEKRILEMKYKLKVTKAAIDFISNEGYDEEYGARPLARAIQHYIEDAIADEICIGHLKEGDTIIINYDKTKQEITVKSGKNVK